MRSKVGQEDPSSRMRAGEQGPPIAWMGDRRDQHAENTDLSLS